MTLVLWFNHHIDVQVQRVMHGERMDGLAIGMFVGLLANPKASSVAWLSHWGKKDYPQ